VIRPRRSQMRAPEQRLLALPERLRYLYRQGGSLQVSSVRGGL